MKCKKYILILIAMFIFMSGINTAYAKEIYNYTGNIINEKTNNIIMHMADNRIEDPICTELFGDKNAPNSIRGLINDILEYPKYIVPILVILFGTLDLAKAVIASKEDEMKKAQSTFVKRLLIGVVIFFVPLILDLIMYFADIVLGYTTCGL